MMDEKELFAALLYHFVSQKLCPQTAKLENQIKFCEVYRIGGCWDCWSIAIELGAIENLKERRVNSLKEFL